MATSRLTWCVEGLHIEGPGGNLRLGGTPECHHCGCAEDTARHTVEECPARAGERPRSMLQKKISSLESQGTLDDDCTMKENRSSFIVTQQASAKHPIKVPPGSPEITTKSSDDKQQKAFESEIKRFIEISKYFSSPCTKTASYRCENCLIKYPSTFFVEYKRGNITTFHIKFSNLKLDPVYLKLYKMIPQLEEVKYVNMSLSMCKRVPPGLSFNLGIIYDDVNERTPTDAKLIFVASRKSTTPCYQVCEIDLKIQPLKRKAK